MRRVFGGFHKGNIFANSKLMKKGLVVGAELIPRKDMRRPRPLTKSEKGVVKEEQTMVSVLRSHLTPVQFSKQVVL